MRVLLVEDSSRLRWSLILKLKKAGYVVDESGDGIEGLWKAETGDYDLVILDVMLPGMDGLEVLSKLRARGTQTHILLLTACDTVDDRVKGLATGADDYLVKPFALAELLARVNALCRRSYSRKSSLIEVEGLSINLNTREVAVSGKVVELLPREFRILEVLVLRRGEVVSRREIENHIYDETQGPVSNTIESAVSLLRKKLAKAGSKAHIQTKRGFGYLLTS